MKKRLALTLVIIFAASFFTYRQTAESRRSASSNNQTLSEIKPQNFQAVAFGVTGKISDIAPLEKLTNTGNKVFSVSDRPGFLEKNPNIVHDADAHLINFSAVPMPTPTLSFDGISNRENNDAYGFAVIPPDMNGDVGPNHFVQSVNILTRIYNKNGAPLTPAFKLSDVFAVLNTPCSVANFGNPITLYDPLADRWILSQFCTNAPPFRQMIAISQTSDPTGAYFAYEFVMPNLRLNDFPKLGVWTDAYYMSTDEFVGNDFRGNGVFAFDKKKMLAGDANAGFIYFNLPTTATERRGGYLPSDLDGLNAPPANAPNTFITYTATEYGDANDALRLFDFHADFTNPNNSTFIERAESPIIVAPFDPTSPPDRVDIAQPAPGEFLDAQSDRLMYRAAYRNFGASESLVVNQTVRVTPVNEIYRAGVRVYELRKQSGAFAVREQATIGTNDLSRWIGSAAQDNQGNLAIGYSAASEIEKPSIRYSGKLASEPVGTFRTEENLIKGTGVQTGFGYRWGDYSQMTVDPSDDCTFWTTGEYYTAASQAESPYGWLTRIGRFKFAECTNAPRATISGAVTNASNNQPLANAVVTANAVYTRSTNVAGNYGNLTVVPNTYNLTATANGFRSQTVTVTIVNGQILTQNFALEPVAILNQSGLNITSESCAVNNAVDPNETVTLSIALRNTGAKNTTNLTATLLATGGIFNPSSSQNYGALIVNGASISRPFTFTAAPTLRCGDLITLTLQLNDGAENLGTITISLNAGARRIAFQEEFDLVNLPNLPAGWTTSASGAQAIWETTEEHFESPPNSVHSFAASQLGVNQLTSPMFRVNSESAKLIFRNRYDLETTFLRNRLYDGAVLEIKIGTIGRFQDILAAGGAFESGGYDGTIDACCQNPLAGRLGWSGKSGVNQTPAFVTAAVKLPASAAGKNIQLRWRVGTDNGTSRDGQFVDNVRVEDGFVCACQIAPVSRAPFDFDGDGKTDLSVFRPSDNPNEPDFYVQNSANNSFSSTAWGSVGDVPVNADYDGDGKTDYAVFRPSSGIWFVLRSADNSMFSARFGLATDRLVPNDFDGDRRADIAVFRNGVWYILQSFDAQIRAVSFGANGDLPVPSDFDGDDKTDVAVFRPSSGSWFVRRSSDGNSTGINFGQSGDKPVVGDFDSDRKADFVVFRPSNGVWYLQKSAAGFSSVPFGQNGDQPLQTDFDGDGKRDIAVNRNGFWYYLRSSDGVFVAKQFGANSDVPLATIFVY
ncbi:MAG: carboxypeptidase regulatory-like domain-containing protein [Pyrinomonadaceae bacterium]|nr:carboxypeptidase regulatory-like domain-containing protein [Pyrinomonadaceae bacterium]